MANAPAGAQMAVLDIASAFRTIPVLPAHKAYTVICLKPDEYYIDHVVAFGLASGNGVQGAVMDALVDILHAEGLGQNTKWVDDLANIRVPVGRRGRNSYRYSYDVHEIFKLSADLGIPWGADKCIDHAFQAVYLGFLWDLEAHTVSLPEDKRLKYRATLSSVFHLIRTKKAHRRHIQSINGTLTHVTFVYPHGRAYLNSLLAFVSAFDNSEPLAAPPATVISDMRWWMKELGRPNVARSLRPRRCLTKFSIVTDASSDWGVGLCFGQRWNAWRWKSASWRTPDREISWAEMIAVELAARYVENDGKIRDADVPIYCDNQEVVAAYDRGRSRNFHINESIRRVDVIGMTLNVRFVLEYIPGEKNPADPVSRGTLPKGRARLAELPSLPKTISRWLDYAVLESGGHKSPTPSPPSAHGGKLRKPSKLSGPIPVVR